MDHLSRLCLTTADQWVMWSVEIRWKSIFQLFLLYMIIISFITSKWFFGLLVLVIFNWLRSSIINMNEEIIIRGLVYPQQKKNSNQLSESFFYVLYYRDVINQQGCQKRKVKQKIITQKRLNWKPRRILKQKGVQMSYSGVVSRRCPCGRQRVPSL